MSTRRPTAINSTRSEFIFGIQQYLSLTAEPLSQTPSTAQPALYQKPRVDKASTVSYKNIASREKFLIPIVYLFVRKDCIALDQNPNNRVKGHATIKSMPTFSLSSLFLSLS